MSKLVLFVLMALLGAALAGRVGLGAELVSSEAIGEDDHAELESMSGNNNMYEDHEEDEDNDEQDFEDLLLQVLQDSKNQHPTSAAGAGKSASSNNDNDEENADAEDADDDEDNNNEEDDEKYDEDTETVPASEAGSSKSAVKNVVSAPGAAATHDPEAFLSVQAKAGTDAERRRRRRFGIKIRIRRRRRSRRCRKRCKRRCRRRYSGPLNMLKRRRCVRRCRKRCNRRSRNQIQVGGTAASREEELARMQARNARFRSKLGSAVQRYAAKQTRKLIKWFITNYLNHASVRQHVAGRGLNRDIYMPEPGPTPSDPEAPQTDGRRRPRRNSRRRRRRSPPRIPGLLQSVPRFG